MNRTSFLLYAAKEYFVNGTLYASQYFKLEKNGTMKELDPQINSKLCVPATNIAFSLELIFKAFLLHKGKKKNVHNLVELYKLLDENIKEKILEHYGSHNTYKNYVSIRLGSGVSGDHGKMSKFLPIKKNAESIYEILETHKNAFNNFRYIHELEKGQEWLFSFRELSNFTLSALVILGQTLNITILVNITKEQKMEE